MRKGVKRNGRDRKMGEGENKRGDRGGVDLES